MFDEKIFDFREFDFYYSPDTIIYFAPKFSKIVYAIEKEGIHSAISFNHQKQNYENNSSSRTVLQRRKNHLEGGERFSGSLFYRYLAPNGAKEKCET